jgi:TPR repeat protein
LNNKPYADKTFGFLCIPVALVLDAILYSVFGNTPGKALVGFKIKNAEGQALGFSQYLGRNLKVYVRGFGLGLPIVNFITMYNQSIRLRKGQQASYDETTGFRVYKQPVGWIRKTLFGCAFLLLFTVMSMLNLIEKSSNPKPTTITNQEISTNTTPQPEYQVNITNDNLQQANNLFIQNKFAEALPPYQKLAEQNNAQAQTILGYMHETGKGVQVDYSQSIYLFRKAAEQGDSEAQYRLGSMYKTGRGIAQDNDQAVYWYQKSAIQGYAIAQNRLARIYDNGDGVKQDFSQAVYWYQKAAQQGSASAQVSLGWHYMNGLGNLPKDYKQAAYWNELGAQNGDSEGANNLGWLYEHGLGVAQDLTKAAELYQKAINRGIEIGVEKERIDEAKSRLAGLTKLRQLNKPSDKKVVVTETNDTLQVNIDDEKKFEIRGNLPRLKKELSESRLSPVHKYESNNGEKVIKQECIIKPVMTKAELSNCQN